MIEQHPLLIGGAWVRGESQQVNENPSDLHSPVGEFDVASTDHVDLAVEAALAAFPVWAREPSHRVECLDQIGKRLWAERERLGTVLSAEEGKPLREGIGEVVRASKTFSYYAHQVMSAQGDVLPSGRSRVQIHTRRRPLGVVAVISPWNFPIAVPAWKIAPALAAGNSVVFKAAESVPASAWELARVIHESGVPAGTFNLVTGKGSVVGERLANHEQIAALTFTGSTKVGQHLLSTAHASSNLRVQAEMGGKNPLIITEDASIDHAVSVTLDSCYGSTGQRCTASSRIIVESGILDEFVERLAHRMNELRVGHALDAQTDIGPVANASQLRVNLDAIELGLREGATLLTGGELVSCDTQGHYFSPALFVEGKNSMQLNQQEIFGPIACVIPADNLDEAITLANDVPYGLSSGIVTSSLRSSEEFQRRAEAGLVSVNASPAISELHAPFGGVKQSSYGPREQGERAFEFYTAVSTHFVQAEY